jgi:hypothetical protein
MTPLIRLRDPTSCYTWATASVNPMTLKLRLSPHFTKALTKVSVDTTIARYCWGPDLDPTTVYEDDMSVFATRATSH